MATKILVGLSGGVDSAVAARLLQEQGLEIAGVCLRMHPYSDLSGAKAAAEQLGIPLIVEDQTALFDRVVRESFVEQYCLGKTPNPCVLCNRYVKFEGLLQAAQKNGFDGIATGHYAGKTSVNGRLAVRRSPGPKDQSYMLWGLTQTQLAQLHLPLTELEKPAVRELARKWGLSCAEAPDSQEICFLPDGDHASYIESLRGAFPQGNFVDTQGRVLGKHRGIIRYTIGQRKGLGIALGEPMFVLKIDAQANQVVLGRAREEYMPSAKVGQLHFGGVASFEDGERFYIKIRSAAPAVPCTLRHGEQGAEVLFDTPQRAVTPGQSAVFYRDDWVAFGGIFE
ncbi:MAG: tRNA 2-thiouridine(34) synthase MnmA [Clostridia bacterium]|nr:tRNA 2-thiouridine(34) synthase MnmA [Clostridia bacterium]